jgi:RHS repeat-associated protein
LEQKSNSGPWYEIYEGTAGQLSFTNKPDGTYHYRVVRETCLPDCIKFYGSSQSIVVSTAPEPPEPLTGPDQDDGTGYTISWPSVTGASTYELQRQLDGGSWSTVQNTSATSKAETSMTDGEYGYRARSCDPSCGDWSTVKTVDVLDIPSVPSAITGPDEVNKSSGAYTLNWSSVPETTTHYELQESVNNTLNFSTVSGVTGTSKGFTGKGEGAYHYRVRACNTVGGTDYCSDWSGLKLVDVAVFISANLTAPSYNVTGAYVVSWNAGGSSDTDILQESADGGAWTDVYWAHGDEATISGRPHGEYRYRVHRTTDMHPDEDIVRIVRSTSTTVTIPPAVVTESSTTAGNIPFSAGVTKGGDAYINIPITPAPGVNGLVPNLALSYGSSRLRTRTNQELPGDILGYGWSVAGLSEIRRCVKGQANSNSVDIDSSDYACLNGEPLVLVGGTYWSPGSEYRTLRESYQKIILQGTAAEPWFEVYTPDGGVIEYGNSDDSRIRGIDYVIDQGEMTEEVTDPFLWSINQRKDAFGNEMVFTYHKDEGSGVNHPAKIEYGYDDGSDFDALIEFEYVDRADQETIALGDTTLDQLLALQRIKVSLDGVAVREYRVENELSTEGWLRVNKVQLCGYNTAGTSYDCLVPVDVDWDEPSVTLPNHKTFVEKITDSNGAQTKFTYDVIPVTGSKSFLYEDDDGPFGDEPATLPTDTEATPAIGGNYGSVVTKVEGSDGIGGWFSKSYAYHGRGLRSTKNWGFLGFYGTRIKDDDTGVVTYNQYRYDFPHFADVVEIHQYDGLYTGTNELLTKTVIERSDAIIEHGAFDDTYLPYVSTSTSFVIEGGTVLGAAETTHTLLFDSSDFVTDWDSETIVGDTVTGPTGEGDFWGDVGTYSLSIIKRSVTTDRHFDDETGGTDWLVGFQTESLTSHYPGASTGSSDQTQKVTSTRLADTNRVATQDVFPDTGDENIHLDITNTYDSYGNLKKVSAFNNTVASSNIGTRDSELTFLTGEVRYPDSVDNALDHQTDLEFDARFGSVTSVTDPNGRETTMDYDEFGREIERTTPDLIDIDTSYDLCSVVTCSSVGSIAPFIRVRTSSSISPTQTQYLDILGRVIRTEVDSFSGSTEIRRDTVYDSNGRIEKVSHPYLATGSPVWVEYEYDIRNRIERVDRPDNGYTTIDFAVVSGEVEQKITDKVYKADGTTVADTQIKLNYFDVLGQLRQTIDADGSTEEVQTDYTYYGSGLLHTVKVDNDSDTQTTLEYDNSGNRTKITGPDFGEVLSEYSAAGELTKQTDEEGNVLEWGYDALGRVKTLKENTTTTATWSYDPTNAKGALYQRKYNTTEFVETHAYNSSAELTSITTEIDVAAFSKKTFTHSFTYLTDGRIDDITYPSGITVEHTYNSQGYLSVLTDASDSTDLVTYNDVDAFGSIKKETYGNGVITERVFDIDSGRLTDIDTKKGSTEIQDNVYAWQTNGILESRVWADGSSDLTETFGYDSLNRLEDADTKDGSTVIRELDFDYDDLGNITSKLSDVTADTDVTNYTYGTPTYTNPYALNSVNIGGVMNTISFDGNGNITKYDAASGDDRFFVWNARNLPTEVIVGDSLIDTTPTAKDELSYGPDGQRFYKKSTWDDSGTQRTEHTFYVGQFEEFHTHAGDTTLDKVQKSRVGTSVLHIKEFPDTGSPTTSIEYMHRDHLGSVERITDENGTELRIQAFDPFGGRREDDWSADCQPSCRDDIIEAQTTSTSRGFTGHEHMDRTGIIHMNGRIYDPLIGRFLSPDPIVQAPTYSQSWNRYSYVWNSPMSYVDPTGFINVWSRCGDRECESNSTISIPIALLGGGVFAGDKVVENDGVDRFGGDGQAGGPDDGVKPVPINPRFDETSRAQNAPAETSDPMEGLSQTDQPIGSNPNPSFLERISRHLDEHIRFGWIIEVRARGAIGFTIDAGSVKMGDKIDERWTKHGKVETYSEGRTLAEIEIPFGSASAENRISNRGQTVEVGELEFEKGLIQDIFDGGDLTIGVGFGLGVVYENEWVFFE